MPNNIFSAISLKKAKKACRTMTHMPNSIFSCQTTFEKTKFLGFGFYKCQPGIHDMKSGDPLEGKNK